MESTAHTFSVAIVSDEGGKCNILANERHSVATKEGGLIPRELAVHHLEYAKPILESALKKSGTRLED
ncbi:MAG: tRNA threonylcarbamoyladenosine biosynthesis protein, partial [Candidatus Diapherotrites archaeon]|nr:tRNA threonylcarbamoyladenosine biosynthesis protein [Candidatus Diapherotrites archaeon]